MLTTLIESRRTHAAARGPMTTSVVMHATLIGLAVLATASETVIRREEPVHPLIYRVQPVLPAVDDPAPVTSQRGTRSLLDRVAPIVVPDVPRIDVGGDPVLPGPIVPDPSPGLQTTLPGTSGTAPASGVYTELTVDRAVVPRAANGQPQFPQSLRNAGVEGDVAVRFVVDSTGRVDARSIVVLQSSHALFAQSVRRWLERTRYAPAEVRGKPVRQLVEQRVSFSLTR